MGEIFKQVQLVLEKYFALYDNEYPLIRETHGLPYLHVMNAEQFLSVHLPCLIFSKHMALLSSNTDGHVSYKGFAKDVNLTQVVLRADFKQYVKQGIYHIQNVNSLHKRVKKWIDSTFWGVSTKYLQNYMNWFRIK